MIGRLVAEAVLDDWAIQGLIHSDQPTCQPGDLGSIDQNLISPLPRRQHEKVRVFKIYKILRSLSKCSDMGDVQANN